MYIESINQTRIYIPRSFFSFSLSTILFMITTGMTGVKILMLSLVNQCAKSKFYYLTRKLHKILVLECPYIPTISCIDHVPAAKGRHYEFLLSRQNTIPLKSYPPLSMNKIN